MNGDFQTHLHSNRVQREHSSGLSHEGLACIIHSNHPLAICLIKEAVSAGIQANVTMKTYSANYKPSQIDVPHILILDTCSIQEWAACLENWHKNGGIALALVSLEPMNADRRLQVLHLGATGILTFGDDLNDQLPRAIDAVIEGHVWIKRDVLTAYVDRTRAAIHNLSVSGQGLTSREKQILELLQHNWTNRMIAHKLAISERTIKFHVSNILRKFNVTKRRELTGFKFSGVACLSDTSKVHCISQSA